MITLLRLLKKASWRRAVCGVVIVVVITFSCLHRASRKSLQPPGIWPEERRSATGFHFKYGDECNNLLNAGGWVGEPLLRCDENMKLAATCGPGHENSWQWSSEAAKCGAMRMAAKDVMRVLQGKWVAMVGDSIARNVFAALLRLLSKDEEQKVITGHKDFEYTLPGNIRASFHWTPYSQNLTSLLQRWKQTQQAPDQLIISLGLWHMLHVTSAAGFAKDLTDLRNHVNSLTVLGNGKDEMGITMGSISAVYPPKLRTEDKRQRLTLQNVAAYNAALADSRLLVPEGHLYLLDIHQITNGCGPECTVDGVHYMEAAYDAALQIWVNNLRILLGG